MSQREAWLSGPVEGITPHLMPVAHALLQAAEDASRAAQGLTVYEVWARPGAVASIGFHLKHIPGVLDRLFTYARGEQLSDGQLASLRSEEDPGVTPPSAEQLIRAMRAAVDDALEQLRHTSDAELLAIREVGRMRIPSNVLGLLFHAAEHAQRHTGQIIATAGIIRSAGIP